MEDNFSMDLGGGGAGMVRDGRNGFGMIQAHYVQAHFLLRNTIPNRPRRVQSRAQRSETPVLKDIKLCNVVLYLPNIAL